MTKAYQFSISVHYQEKQLLSKAVRLKFLLLLKYLSCPGRKSLGFKPLPKQPIKGQLHLAQHDHPPPQSSGTLCHRFRLYISSKIRTRHWQGCINDYVLGT